MRNMPAALKCILATLCVSLSGVSQAHANIIINGDFSAGNTGFTNGYNYVNTINSETQYTIAPTSNINGANVYGDWTAVSTLPDGSNGNVLLVNGATSANVSAWTETVTVTPNTNYTFSFSGVDVNSGLVSNSVIVPVINGISETSLQTTQAWQTESLIWNSGTNTSATFSLIDADLVASHNDFAIANISAVSAVPLPGSFGFFVAAVLGLMGMSVMQSKKARAC